MPKSLTIELAENAMFGLDLSGRGSIKVFPQARDDPYGSENLEAWAFAASQRGTLCMIGIF